MLVHTVHTSLIGRNKSGVSVNMLSSFFEIGQYANVIMRIGNFVTEILQNCHFANSKIYHILVTISNVSLLNFLKLNVLFYFTSSKYLSIAFSSSGNCFFNCFFQFSKPVRTGYCRFLSSYPIETMSNSSSRRFH